MPHKKAERQAKEYRPQQYKGKLVYMVKQSSRTIRISAACLLFGIAASADTVTLRNGTTIEGTYLGGTAREIRLDSGDRIQTFPIDTVSGVQFGSSNSARNSQENSNRQPDPPQYSTSASSQTYPQNSPQQGPPPQELPSGTQLTVRLIDTVDSESSRMGDTYRASIDEPVVLNGNTLIPRGADVTARLVEDQKSGKIQGRTILKLILTSVTVNGRPVDISTQDVIKESSSRGARSAKVIGGTAALGAIIGGIAGGGKGAAIGAGSGAAVGTGVQELGHGQRVRIPSETRLVFTLANPARI